MPCSHGQPDWRHCQGCLRIVSDAAAAGVGMAAACELPVPAQASAMCIIYLGLLTLCRLFTDSGLLHNDWLRGIFQRPQFLSEARKLSTLRFTRRAAALIESGARAVFVLFLALGNSGVRNALMATLSFHLSTSNFFAC